MLFWKHWITVSGHNFKQMWCLFILSARRAMYLLTSKMKNRSHIYDINLRASKNRPRSTHGHKYSKNKKYLSMLMPSCTSTRKQHVKLKSWKVNQHWGWVEKSVFIKRALLIKKACNSLKAKVAIIQKTVNWFALEINWLISIWW